MRETNIMWKKKGKKELKKFNMPGNLKRKKTGE